jgi:hypothetical protein
MLCPPWNTGDTAAEIATREGLILSDALSSGSLCEVRARHGYHLLQRRDETAAADLGRVAAK